MDWNQIYGMAARQRGLLAVRQSSLLGLSASTLRTHLLRRGWRLVAPGVWLAPGAPAPDRLAVRAAVLHVGAPVAVAGWTAAAVHGLHPPRALTQLLVPAGRRATTLRRVQTTRTRLWDEDDVTMVEGLPVTTMARTVRDLAGAADLDALRRLVIDARQRRLLALEEVVGQLARSRVIAGRQKLVQIVRELDADLVDSEFERLVVKWLRSTGLPVVAQYPLQTADRLVHLDLALPDLRIAIECNGFGSHAERRDQTVDSIRVKAIQAEDWRVVPLAWDEFTGRKAQFLAQLFRTMSLR